MRDVTHLVLVDRPGQVADCARLRRRLGSGADVLILAGNGQAQLALEEQGIEAQPSHLYWDWRGLKAYSESVHRQRLSEFWSDADRLLAAVPGQRYGAAFAPVFWRSLDLIVFFDTILMKIKEIDDLICGLKPQAVHCGISAFSDGISLLTASDSLYGLLAPLVGRERGVLVECSLADDNVSSVATNDERRPVAGGSIVRRVVRKLRRDLLGVASFSRWHQRKLVERGTRPCVVAVQQFMNFAPLEERIEVVKWLDDRSEIAATMDSQPDIAEPVAKAVCELPSFKRLCCYLGYDFSAVAAARLKAFLTEGSIALYRRFAAAEKALASLRPSALLSNSMGSHRTRTIAAAARYLGIPVILTPHGQIGDHRDSVWQYFDLPHADHYVLFTPDSKKYVEQIFAPRAELHWAGCARQDEVLKPKLSRTVVHEHYGLADDRPLVVYVTIPPAGNFHRIGVTVANTKSFDTSCQILDTIRANTRANIIVKGLPGDTPDCAPLMRYVTKLDDRRIVYAKDFGFVQFLDAADCLVLDHPAYTLTEALTRRQRLFVFNETYDWEPEAISLLREDATFELDLAAFVDKLGTSLQDGSAFSGRQPSGAFLRKWVDPCCDGSASERFSEVVMKILDGARLDRLCLAGSGSQ